MSKSALVPPAVGRAMPIGAEVVEGGVHFRVWAPARTGVSVVLNGDRARAYALDQDEQKGYFSAFVEGAQAGDRYQFLVAGEELLLPDPASRFQPEGPHGPSQIVDPTTFQWTDKAWVGADLKGQVIYEMHLGTFTPEGTWKAAAEKLPHLAETGITMIEVMPVADFPGKFGWGYDGVNMFAPSRLYGTPDDFRAFVDHAHALGIAVILDIVYNHIGPDGNYVGFFSKDFVSTRYSNEWGDALNFDGENSHGVREFFLSNAEYWIREFHLDGYRLDATQQIFDASRPHILAEVGRRTRAAAGKRKVVLINENEDQWSDLVRSESVGGIGLDALWNDDYHHSAMVALTGQREAYYSDHAGTPQELISSIKYGYLFQGQYYTWQKKRRGTAALDLPPEAFVMFLENHDQLANASTAERLHKRTSPARYRAMMTLTCLAPGTPMLFQGQEFSANSPWYYFADHEPKLAEAVFKGRRQFMSQFLRMNSEEGCDIPDPAAEETFRKCVIDWADKDRNKHSFHFHRDLLKLRREDSVLRAQKPRSVDGALLFGDAFLLRFFGEGGDDRLLIINLGKDLRLTAVPEPLIAPPPGMYWDLKWSSEEPEYGGTGIPVFGEVEQWLLPSESALFMVPRPRAEKKEESK